MLALGDYPNISLLHFSPFVRAIIYGDLFNYPLTEDEVWEFAVTDGSVKEKDFQEFLTSLPDHIVRIDGYFCLSGREDIITKRKQRILPSTKKIQKARHVARLLSRIPTIMFIGISGSLARLNADANDDIDFFIITTKGTVWITRLLVALFLERYGLRRKWNAKREKDTICANMYLDEVKMLLDDKRRDLYTAHEITQLIPLINRNQTYEKFWKKNVWIKHFLPQVKKKNGAIKLSKHPLATSLHNSLITTLAKMTQLWYMKRHRTREEVSDTLLAFHPKDYRHRILSAYEKRLKTYEKI